MNVEAKHTPDTIVSLKMRFDFERQFLRIEIIETNLILKTILENDVFSSGRIGIEEQASWHGLNRLIQG